MLAALMKTRYLVHPEAYSQSGSSYQVVLRWWACPLPPSGPLIFICLLGSGEIKISMNAQLVLEASQYSVRAWPDDQA
jgi:hypothetical protein